MNRSIFPSLFGKAVWPAVFVLALGCCWAYAEDPNPFEEPPVAKGKEKPPADDDQKPPAAGEEKPAPAEETKPAPAGTAEKPAAKSGGPKSVSTKSPYRPLAPGVLETIDPLGAFEDSHRVAINRHASVSVKRRDKQELGVTVSRHDIQELLAVDKKFDWAKDVPFRHDVWALKFQFKPVRMIWVDIPQPSGYMQRTLIWYLVYSVTNSGKVLHPVEDADLPYDTSEKKQLYDVKTEDRPVRFVPEFLLEGYQHMKDDLGFRKAYCDRVIPVAMQAIREREDPKRKFLNTVEMCREIGVGETYWGIATWEGIDPRIVRFSIYVTGLTNVYTWKDGKAASAKTKAGDPIPSGRILSRKVLKLNFWRPADTYYEHEEEVRFGQPNWLIEEANQRPLDTEKGEGLDYEWVYR
jgi:hypothetical protein